VKQLQVGRRNRPVLHERIEVNDLFPERGPIQHDRHLLRQLLRLRQRQNFEQLIHGPEATRKHHQRLRQVREPELAHEKVMEFEVQFMGDVGIRKLLKRQPDVQPDGLAVRIHRAAVRRLHDARAAARTHHKPVRALAECLGPRSHHRSQLPRVFVVLPERPVFANTRRPEENHRIANPLPPEMRQRLQIFGNDPERPRIGPVQELFVLICEGRT